ncbi:glycosyltransferase [Pseudoteredinibacter isoporae]|uniref:Glycosyltransferase involved in cell wall biosynthesis n=1 Tax=Pseudoteredinibacter isoporae TaxID=570281 RepID=A0A7X0JUB3_9GAMM|nr:glycosyltransferase [Pseudoteredinibacter isoporae]MBB6522403.1 glycosyltransferase involved in cell wall biosynthesis [Pseudoteredinibacter isoporae]NHO87936.1 glycosyltransferase [Pseudoteredinibacter isoporae]NIB23733.1 glycosyltransferase [Pseudoteredinibacter isoporae]
MRICEILASTGEGGLEKHMLDLCNTMAGLGHDVHVIVDPYFASRFDSAVQVHSLNMGRSRNNPMLLWQLHKLIKSINPDVVHAQANKAASLLSRIKGFLKLPSVGTIHNQKSKSAMFSSLDGVIGVSQGACSVVNNANKRCVYNGVTLESQLDRDSAREKLLAMSDASGERPVAVALARLVEVKRIDLLLQAWEDMPADLLILGDGPLMATLKEQAAPLIEKGNVHFCGFVKDAAMLLPGADFMVISSDREGFPYSMVEALCAGVPVISTEVAAAREMLPASLRVALGDAEGLAAKIAHFLATPEAYQEDLDALFEKARAQLNVEYMTKETVAFLESVTAQANH